MIEHFLQDIRYGLRLLRRDPGFAIVAILSLALGIGANTAIFQLLDSLRMRVLPVQKSEELVQVRIADRKWASGSFFHSYSQLTFPMWDQIRNQQQAFSSMAVWGPDIFNLATGGEVHFARGMYVSGDFFNVLGVKASVGRVFDAKDDSKGCGANGVVISDSFWQKEYGRQISAIGRKISLDGKPFEILGVTPPSFFGVEVGRHFDVAVPVCAEPLFNPERPRTDTRHAWWLAAFGRLKPGWTREKADAHFKSISKGIFEATLPTAYDADGVKHFLAYKLGAFPGESGYSSLRREYETPLLMLMAITGLVLLICCANLANLMLARASTREREVAVRLALGASRPRLIRQLLVESLLLAVVGATLGAGLARVLSQALVAFISTENTTLFLNLDTDWRMLAFISGLAMLTCILFGLAPALRATRVPPNSAIKAGSRGMTAGRERHGLRRALVVSQVAFSLVLLVGALLFARSLRNLMVLDAGFRQDGILIANLDWNRIPLAKERRLEFEDNVLRRIQSTPGVEGAASAAIIPLSGSGWNQNVVLNGQKKENTNLTRISPGYFRTLGTALLVGRDFNEQDTNSAPKVAIVNESFVSHFFPGDNPIGKTFKLDVYQGEADYTFEIVGVVRNTKYYELREDFPPITFLPAAQSDKPGREAQMVIRANIPLTDLIANTKRTLKEINPEISVLFQVFQTQIRETLLRERLMATLSSFFGVLAGLLAVIGLYGVISYMVVRRTNEIGIRMALGANARDIVRMVLREAGGLLAIGMGLGTVLAVILARTAESMLFGLHPEDPTTILFSILALSFVAVGASYLPARRASQLEPMTALRDE
ncbi:MAG: ABC transporter permease [Acidobacteria bacterium]|nr:ABC transporter permease [Acidobacteriota bacterium]